MKKKKFLWIIFCVIIVVILFLVISQKMGWLGGGYVQYVGKVKTGGTTNTGTYYFHTRSETVKQSNGNEMNVTVPVGANEQNPGYQGSYTSAAARFMDKILGIKQPAARRGTPIITE